MTAQSTLTTAAPVRDVFRNGRFEPDNWQVLDADAAIPAGGEVFLSLGAFRAADADGSLGNRPVGIILQPADKVADLAPFLSRLSAVAVNFPKFNDGRGFSHAAHLVRLGFAGEIRAVGDVLIDQITAMKRQGFTAFEIRHAVTRRYLSEGRDPAPRHYYQPSQIKEPPAGTRPWMRQAKD